MTAKEYLGQARYLDNRINSKIQQVASLNDLATKCTATITGMPHSPNHSTSSMEDAITKIIDLQGEICKDMNLLVETKAEIVALIKQVEDKNYQTLLEERYLCFLPWEQIAVDMDYDIRWVYRLHGKALASVQEILDSRVA